MMCSPHSVPATLTVAAGGGYCPAQGHSAPGRSAWVTGVTGAGTSLV